MAAGVRCLSSLRRGHPASGAASGDGAGVVSVKRVAVLPFENLGVSRGRLLRRRHRRRRSAASSRRSREWEVIARASSTPYKKTMKTPTQIARELERGIPPHGDGGVGEGRGGSQPRPRHSRAGGGPGVRQARPPGGGSLLTRRSRMYFKCSRTSRRGLRRRWVARRGGGREAAFGEADAEPGCLRRVPPGRRGLERHLLSTHPAVEGLWGSTSRRSRWTPTSCRPGESRVQQFALVRRQGHARFCRARAAGR